MKSNRRIILYGNSVILGSIGASLRRSSEFEVTTLARSPQDTQTVDTVKPGIVVFDLEGPPSETPFFFLKTHPSIVLIGISPGDNLVQVYSSQQLPEMSLEALFELIKSEAVGK